MAEQKYGVVVEFPMEYKQRLLDACGLVPARRMFRTVILQWLESEEAAEAEQVEELHASD